MTAERLSPRQAGTKSVPSVLKAAAAIALLSVALAGCGSTSQTVMANGKREIDPKLGVAPSPRVVAMGEPVPKGGGRNMVGKPYKVAGKRYVPRHDPDYKAVGLASWYGDAFHGRKTANGEVFDANHLSAAHPTMPLPSYARVTSVDTGRSVIVRVNDRGPFHSNRVLDMSRRTAEMLGIRAKGVAKIQVAYVGPAPVNGDDTPYLMASYRGPSDVPVGMPETMIASASPLPGVTAKAAPPAPVQTAVAETSAPAVKLVSVAALPPQRPVVFEAFAQVASVDPADVQIAGAPVLVASAESSAAPLATPAVLGAPAGWQVGAQPVGFQADPGTAAAPAAIDAAFPTPAPSPRTSYAADRIASAYAAVDAVGGNGVGLADLSRSLDALATGRATEAATLVQVGVFADPANAARIADALNGVGTLRLEPVTVDGRAMTRVRMVALASGLTVDEAVLAAERAGARGARAVR